MECRYGSVQKCFVILFSDEIEKGVVGSESRQESIRGWAISKIEVRISMEDGRTCCETTQDLFRDNNSQYNTHVISIASASRRSSTRYQLLVCWHITIILNNFMSKNHL